MNKTTKKILFRYMLSPVIMAGFLWLVYQQIRERGSFKQEWQQFAVNIHGDNLKMLAWVLLLAPINWLVESFKWKFLLSKIEHIPVKKAFISVLSGIAFAFITPNKTGDFIGRIIYLKKKNRFPGAMASIMGSVAQIIITFFFGFTGMLYLQLTHASTWTLTVLITVTFGFLLSLYLFIHIEWFSRLAERFRKLRALVIAFYLLKRYSRRELWKVLGFALLRFCIYNGQFLILLAVFQSGINFGTGFLLSGLMFWMITVMPTFFVADIGVRGFVTALIFINTGIAENPFTVLTASYLLWLINLVLPAIFGSLFALIKGLASGGASQ